MALVQKPRRARPSGNRSGSQAAVTARGERTLTLEGMPYRLRPSRRAVMTIEEETGFAALELARAGNAGGLTSGQLGIIAAELIRAGAEDETTRHVGAETIADLIYEEGMITVMATLTLCLIDAVTGGRRASGEAKAATA